MTHRSNSSIYRALLENSVEKYRSVEEPMDFLAADERGFPLYYMDANNNTLCAKCVNNPTLKPTDPEYPVSADINIEYADMTCDECGEGIEMKSVEDEEPQGPIPLQLTVEDFQKYLESLDSTILGYQNVPDSCVLTEFVIDHFEKEESSRGRIVWGVSDTHGIDICSQPRGEAYAPVDAICYEHALWSRAVMIEFDRLERNHTQPAIPNTPENRERLISAAREAEKKEGTTHD